MSDYFLSAIETWKKIPKDLILDPTWANNCAPALLIDSKQSYPTQVRFLYYLIITQTSPKSTLQGLNIVVEISKSNL